MAPRRKKGPLEAKVDAATSKMAWLEDSDAAVVELAKTYARRIDDAIAMEAGPDVTKALYLGPHLLNTIRALGGAPEERLAITAPQENTAKEVDPVDDLHKKRQERRRNAAAG